MITGGCGGFFASVRAIGATGQQQQASKVSAEEAVRGGAGGFFISRGGGTKPGSPVPSPAPRIVPEHRVAASAVPISCLALIPFMACRNQGILSPAGSKAILPAGVSPASQEPPQ